MKQLFSAIGSYSRPHTGKMGNNSSHIINNNDDPRARKIDMMWHFFHAFPNKSMRFYQSRMAAQRFETRRKMQTSLPVRQDFMTTAAYFEAVMPLVLARHRFVRMFHPNTFLQGVHRALERMQISF